MIVHISVCVTAFKYQTKVNTAISSFPQTDLKITLQWWAYIR